MVHRLFHLVSVTALIVSGCSEGYDIPATLSAAASGTAAGEMADGDVKCLNDDEPGQGDTCTQDCLTTALCAGDHGQRVCTCEGGVFVQCVCLPPDNWPYEDVPTAPYCDRLTGEPRYLNAGNCSTVGEQCFSSTLPGEGCTCVMSPDPRMRVPTWTCGALPSPTDGSPECESIGNKLMVALDEKPCDTEWQLCVARDYNPEGTSPRGCICMANGEWYCGGTNRWYRPE